MYVILNKRPDRNGFVKISLSQGDFYCGASSQADIIRNYFLKFPRISSIFLKIPLSSQFPPSSAGRLEQLKQPWFEPLNNPQSDGNTSTN